MPESIGYDTALKLNRVLKDGGYWFIKLNPFYSAEELKGMEYEEMGPHMYGENGILRLKQEATPYWMEIFNKIGQVERYVEFPYEWQSGMNRIFMIKKTGSMPGMKIVIIESDVHNFFIKQISTHHLTVLVIYVIVQIEQELKAFYRKE